MNANKHIISSLRSGKALMVAAAMIACAAPAAFAQEDLKQEITVKHHEEVKPTDAVKLNVSPTVTMPPLSTSKLNYGMRQIAVGVPASISSLAPAAYADTIYRSPFRGYAGIGYLPAFNLGASAGYKFVDNDRLRVNGWMQYDGTSYRGDMPWYDENVSGSLKSMRVRRNTFSVGGALHSAVGRDSYLDLGLDYIFARFNTLTTRENTGEQITRNQNVHRFNAQGLWTMTTGIWNCGIGLGYGHFGYGNPLYVDFHPGMPDRPGVPAQPVDQTGAMNPARENKVTARAFASAKVWGAEATGMELKVSYLNYGHHSELAYDDFMPSPVLRHFGSDSHALLSLRPYYRTNWKHIVLDLGVNLDFTFNNGKVFHISPAAQATWKPSNFVTVYVKAKGGEQQNTLGSLFDVTYYGAPMFAYNNSHVMLDGEVGVTVGLFRGFYTELSAGYAIANDWLMPALIPDTRNLTYFEPVNMKGYKFHAALGYKYRNWIDASVSFDMAPQKYNRGYYLWRDRAKYVATAKARITPIEPLDIIISWNYRAKRNMMNYLKLGNVNSLNIGATYRITTQWSAFANVENVTGHRYSLIGGIPSQGVTGLAGVTYKF